MEREHYLNEATAGLRDDPELQLDVRAELTSHLEDTVSELLARGMHHQAAEAEAQKRLGALADLAGPLQEGNRRRMRWRARARLLLQAILVPLAVVAALLFALPEDALVTFATGFSDHDKIYGLLYDWPKLSRRELARLSEDDKLVLVGEPRSLWQSEPDNRVYLGNYITHLISNHRELAQTPAEARHAYLAILRQAEEIDPDNARYAYLQAAELLKQSRTVTYPRKQASALDYAIEIHDQKLYDAAMATLRRAQAMPRYERYILPMYREREALVERPTTFAAKTASIARGSALMLPDLAIMRDLAHATIQHADLMLKNGQVEEALAFADGWQPMLRHLSADIAVYIDALGAMGIGKYGATASAELWRQHGFSDRAEKAAHVADRIQTLRQQRKEKQQTDGGRMAKHAGLLHRVLIPALDRSPTEAELRPLRRTEYILLERLFMMAANGILLAAIILAVAIALRWRWARGGSSVPILLLPKPRDFVRILLLALVLPVLLYALLTRLLPTDVRRWSIAIGWPQLLAQVACLLWWIGILLAHYSTSWTRRRCAQLDIPTPESLRRGWRLAALTLGILLIMAGFFPWPPDAPGYIGLPLLAFGTALIILLTGGVIVTRFCTSTEHRLYYGSTARTIVPLLAMAMLALNLLSGPPLRVAEQHWVRKDPTISPTVPMTVLEAEATRDFRNQLVIIAADLSPTN